MGKEQGKVGKKKAWKGYGVGWRMGMDGGGEGDGEGEGVPSS